MRVRLACLLPLLVSGCLATPVAQRGTPLYPAPNGPLPAGQVARLRVVMPGGVTPGAGASSFIRTVDGREVGEGTVFELLPGCHVVETQRYVVVSNPNTSFQALLPTLVFPFRMTAGHEYDVVVVMTEPMGSTAQLMVSAQSRNPATGQTTDVRPATGEADLAACRDWKPGEP